MTLALPTRYRRMGFRAENARRIAAASDGAEVILKCMRCFQDAHRGTRCDNCRAQREASNKGRKR